MATGKRSSAIVIGGSMAGLLAARVLSDYFERVTVVERDRLPDEAAFRPGVPQARHLHALLVRGQRIMDTLFPGFTGDLTESGAPEGVWGLDNGLLTVGGWTPRFDSGIVSNVCSRINLEWLVRRRLSAFSHVQFLTETDVTGLVTTRDRSMVTGVRVQERKTHAEQTLYADLVVDASGRNSKTPDWLAELGYDQPAETHIDSHCGYASRWYKIPAQSRLPLRSLAIQARPAQGNYRGGGVVEAEGNIWIVTVLGGNRDYPPTDEAGFLEFARSLPSPVIYEAIKDAEPASAIYGYRRLENRMRHYERLARRPEHFIVTGDAACALNPIYGQGMSTAAMEAELLGYLLERWQGRHLTGFATRFQKRLAQITAGPWLMATSEDLRYPDVEGDRPTLMTRFANWYFDRVAEAMPRDAFVTKAFFEAMNLLRDPTSLMRPAVMSRVLWYTLRPRGAALPPVVSEQPAPTPTA